MSFLSGLLNKKATLLMGIVNASGDSFSEGAASGCESALERAQQLWADGADILDIGAESTRPGALEVSADEEIRRLEKVVPALLEKIPQAVISVDTRHSATARRMLEYGVRIINDVSMLRFDKAMPEVLQEYNSCGLILCHSRGTPENMQDPACSAYDGNVVDCICRELLDAADKSGIPADRIIFDPGFGFAKTFEQQLDMMRHAELFKQRLGRVLFGISRKSFIGKITGRENPAERAGGTIAGELHLCRCGAAVIRTHNVKMLRDALAVESVLQRGEFAGS